MLKENGKTKDRDSTEKKILEAVGDIIVDVGFEKVGVNLVAQKAGVSKMLIYRYFGTIDELIARYLLEKDYWINISTGTDKVKDAQTYIKKIFRDQIRLLREDITLRRLYRWEFTTDHPVVNQLREKRETNGCRLVELVTHLTRSPQQEVATLATILSASISYLTLMEEKTSSYNGIPLQSDAGWNQIAEGIDLIIDLWLDKNQPS